MKTRVIILLVVLLVVSCKKDEVSVYADLYTYNCFKQTEWDSTKVAQALEGKWNWEYTGAEGGGTKVLTKKLAVEFKADKTVRVYEKGTLTQSATWLVVVAGDEYYVATTPYINLFWGRVSICADRVEFNAAINDGSTNIFKKEQALLPIS